ncbi:MAG: energy-coupling factor transporter ATPase [Candidatus Bathyarchaeia archaeon]
MRKDSDDNLKGRKWMEDRAIVFENVSWRYEGNQEDTLRDVNLEIRAGETVVITGASGAGKTTLCRCINGLIPHFYEGALKGDVLVWGDNIRTSTTVDLARRVGMCFDNPSNQLFCATVLEEIAFGPQNLCKTRDEVMQRVSEAMKFCRLEKYRDKSPFALSGGEKQAVAIAALIAMVPDAMILDEPTSNIDAVGTSLVFERMAQLIKERKRTTVIVEHKLQYALPMADRLIVISDGAIVADGTPRKVLSDAEFLDKSQIQVPHVTTLAHRLVDGLGEENVPITLEEGVALLSRLIKENKVRVKPARIPAPARSSQKPIISCQDVWFEYPDGTPAVKGVSFDILEGEFVGLVGRNGSGKTTLAKLFNGLYRPTKGKILVDGIDVRNASIAELVSRVGYSFQNPDDQIFAKTVRDELAFGPKNLKLSYNEISRRVESAASEVEITAYLDENPFNLSQGLRQRVAVASVLTLNPKVLIVDEPTTGQDFTRSKIVMNLAKTLCERGRTIIIISHNMDLIAEYCERLVVMLNGQMLLAGPTREVFSQTQRIRESSLEPPQVTQIGQALVSLGLPSDVLTLGEMLQIVSAVK